MKGAVSIDVFRVSPEKVSFISLNRARQKQSVYDGL